MSTEVSWLLETKIEHGRLNELKTLIGEMSDRAEANEPGTLNYLWSISEDGSTGNLYERYESSEAALIHLASFNANFAERLMKLVTPTRMSIYGSPNEPLKEEMAGMTPVYFELAGGFVRTGG